MTLLVTDFLQSTPAAAQNTRRAFNHFRIQSGVVAPTSWAATPLKVTPTSPAGLTVNIAAGAAWVRGTSELQGRYNVLSDAVETRAIESNSSGNPRIDCVVARVRDSQDSTDLTDAFEIGVLTGTPTSGATLNNNTGAAVTPASAASAGMIILATVLVASGASTITATEIYDRRPWAYGGMSVKRLAADTAVAANAVVPVLGTRMEYSQSGRLQIHLIGGITLGSTAGAGVEIFPMVNGAALTSAWASFSSRTATAKKVPLNFRWDLESAMPSSGTDLGKLELRFNARLTTGADCTIHAGTTAIYRDVVNPNRDNGTVW